MLKKNDGVYYSSKVVLFSLIMVYQLLKVNDKILGKDKEVSLFWCILKHNHLQQLLYLNTLTVLGWWMYKHPPYSYDLKPCHFPIFGLLIKILKWWFYIQSIEVVGKYLRLIINSNKRVGSMSRIFST